MKDRMEKFVVLPFSFGCASQSSVEVLDTNNNKTMKTSAQQSRDTAGAVTGRSAEEEMPIKARVKLSSGFLVLPKSKLVRAIHYSIKGIKRISQFIVYKETVDNMEREMEIGYPTDVKHVTHIGLDGSSTTNPVQGWENLKSPEVLSFSSISIKQFEFAMAAQAHSSLLETTKIS